jgi:hypothetical protein
MSILAGLGAVPSNFTVPFTEEPPTGPAHPDNIPTDTDNTARTHTEMNADFNFIGNPTFLGFRKFSVKHP